MNAAVNFRIPLRFMRGDFLRLALTVVALACAVALVCAIDLTNRAVLQAFVEVIDTMAGRAALQVRAGEDGFFPEEVATAVAAVPGVELAVPVVNATAFTNDESGELLTVHGVDITEDAAVRVYEARNAAGLRLDDPLVFLSQPDSIALTRTFAEARGLHEGDSISLETPTGRRRFTVRGLLEPTGIGRVYGGNLVVMDLYAAEAAFTRPGFISRVDVVVERDADLTTVRGSIAARLPQGLRVEAPDQRKADLHRVMKSLQTLLQAVGMLGLAAAIVIAFNRVTAVFEARVWQLGMFQAVGVPTLSVWWELVKESVLLGVIGVTLGIPLGVGLGRLALPVIATATALAYNLPASYGNLRLRMSSLLLAAATGIGAAVCAAAAPAWRAAHQGVATTLRGRGIEQPAAMSGWMWSVRGVVGAGAGLAVLVQWLSRSARWGLLATALIAAAAALAARPLLELAGSLLHRGLGWLAGPTARFATGNILDKPRRTTLTVATLGISLGTVLWLWMVGRSFERSVIDAIGGIVRSDLVVSSSHVASGYLEAPVEDRLVRELEKVPGVVAVAGERMIDWNYAGGPIAIEAVDPTYFTDPKFGQWPLFGTSLPDLWERVARGEAVIVSNNFVLNLKAGVGNTITLATPGGTLQVPIAGVTAIFSSPRGTIVMSRSLYERFWHDQQVTRVFVRTAPATEVATVRAEIARRVGNKYGLRILSSGELVEYFATQVRRAFTSVYVLAGTVLIVVLIGMADTLAGDVADRARELGIIRAVGVEAFHLARMVLAEALMLGALGVILAVATGLGLGVLWVEGTFPYLLGWVLQLHIPYGPAGVVAAMTLAVCIAAALLPARLAMRLDPVVALRHE